MIRHLFTRTLPLLATGLLVAATGWAQTPVSATPNPGPVNGNVTDAPLAIDGDVNTFATITSPTVGNSSISVAFSSTVPASGITRLTVGASGTGQLDLNVLGRIVVSTYENGNSLPTNQLVFSNVVTTPLTSVKAQIDFNNVGPYDRLELSVGGLLNTNNTLLFYEVAAFPAGPLPVKLVSFIGKPTGKTTELGWRTASEENNEYFVIERATSSQQQEYRPIGRVAGHGTSSQTYDYSFVDTQPLAVGYYRLRQVDTDGTSTFSPVVVVRQQARELAWTLYPNPVAEALIVSGPAGSRYELLNTLGQRVLAGVMPLAQAQRLEVQTLPDGPYFLRDASTGDTYRFVKNSAIVQQR